MRTRKLLVSRVRRTSGVGDDRALAVLAHAPGSSYRCDAIQLALCRAPRRLDGLYRDAEDARRRLDAGPARASRKYTATIFRGSVAPRRERAGSY